MKAFADIFGVPLNAIIVIASLALAIVFVVMSNPESIINRACTSAGFCPNSSLVSGTIAETSTKALACAVNSAAAGEKQDCVRLLEENKLTDESYVECAETTRSGEAKPFKADCTVHNFELPQKISKAEDWIPY